MEPDERRNDGFGQVNLGGSGCGHTAAASLSVMYGTHQTSRQSSIGGDGDVRLRGCGNSDVRPRGCGDGYVNPRCKYELNSVLYSKGGCNIKECVLETSGRLHCETTDRNNYSNHDKNEHLNGNFSNVKQSDDNNDKLAACKTQIDEGRDLTPRLQQLYEGLNAPGDCGNPLNPPPWLDRHLFNRGRKFYDKFLFSMSFAETLALVLMSSMLRALRPLIYTGRSDSPLKALRRYFSTFEHVKLWHDGDVWQENDPAREDILFVRGIHNKLSKIMNSDAQHSKVWNSSVEKKGHGESPKPLYPAIRNDLKTHTTSGLLLEGPDNPPFFISQWDMSMTQFQFMGIMVAHPECVGAGAVTDEELESLIHFWRGIGWLLGIDDKYNFCNGSLHEVRALCIEVERRVGIPCLASVDWNYEHMARSLIGGLSFFMRNLSFPAVFRYLAHTLDISIPNFTKNMTYFSCFRYWVMLYSITLMNYFPRFSFLLSRWLRAFTGRFKRRYEKGMKVSMGESMQTRIYPVMTPYSYT